MPDVFTSQWAPLAALVWVALVVTASIVRRKQIGKPIFPKPLADALFVERRASGRELKTMWSRLGGASNCLLVSVTQSDLSITPTFPFNLMFLPDIYGLEFTVPLRSITEVETRQGVFSKYLTVQAADHSFELRLRQPAEFLKAIQR